MARQVGKRWQADAILDGKRTRPIFDTRKEAEAFEQDPTGRTRATVGETFRMACQYLWCRSKDYKRQVYKTEFLIDHLGAGTALQSLSPHLFQDLVFLLRKRGVVDNTINRYTSTLSAILGFAEERGLITNRPKLKFFKVKRGNIRYLNPAEVEALFSHLDHNHKALCDFLLFTGCRLGEALGLTWRDIVSDRVTFWHTKNGSFRTVPLVPKAREALDQSPEGEGPFHHISVRSFWRVWKDARRAAGLGDDPQVKPHVLRHTCASRLVQGGVDIMRVKDWLGHEDVQTTMIYSHLAPDSLFDVAHVLNGSGCVKSADPLPLPNRCQPLVASVDKHPLKH
jgi:integrase